MKTIVRVIKLALVLMSMLLGGIFGYYLASLDINWRDPQFYIGLGLFVTYGIINFVYGRAFSSDQQEIT